MVTINRVGVSTFDDIHSIYQQILDSEDDTVVTVAFPDDDLTTEIVFNDEAHTLTATILETGEIIEWHDIRLCGELLRAVTDLFFNLFSSKWFA